MMVFAIVVAVAVAMSDGVDGCGDGGDGDGDGDDDCVCVACIATCSRMSDTESDMLHRGIACAPMRGLKMQTWGNGDIVEVSL